MKTLDLRGVAALCLAGALGAAAGAHAQVPGSADADFGVGGRRTHDFNNGQDEIQAVAALKDGRFLAVGGVVGPNVVGNGSSFNFTVARFLSDGRIDPSFGVGGRREVDLGAGVDRARALLTLPGGGILAVGNLSPASHADIGLVRYTRHGALDTSFGLPDGQGARTGWNLFDPGGALVHDDGVAVALQSDGRVIVAGTTTRPFGNFRYQRVVVARFTVDGLLDPTFAAGAGYVVLEPFVGGDGADYATAIATDGRGRLGADDRITVTGYTFARGVGFVARLTADGQLDTGFGTPVAGGGRSGRLTLPAVHNGGVHSGLTTIRAARLDPTGRVLVAGTGSDRGFTVIRLLGDGALDSTFGVNGRRTVKFSDPSRVDEPFALALQGNGRVVAAGSAINAASGSPQKDFYVARLNADGSVDASFGDGQGRAVVAVAPATDEAWAMAVEPSGRLLVGGYAMHEGATHHDFALLRLHGDPDRLFWYDHELPPQ